MNPDELKEAVAAFQKSRILLTSYELDIFTFHVHVNRTKKKIRPLGSWNSRGFLFVLFHLSGHQ